MIEVLYADAPSEYYDPATLERLYPSQGWIPATSNANYAFRLTQEGNVPRLELKYIPDGGITVLYSGTGNVSDTFDVTPDGRTVIYSADGITYLQRVGNPSEKLGYEGDLKLIQYQPNYVMLTTEIRYPSGTVFHRTFGVRVHTPTFEYVSSFYNAHYGRHGFLPQ